MDFEKTYQKFLDGTATPEEIEFVRGEMKKASDINGILENVKKDGATEAAEEEKVKKAIKSFRKKDLLKIVIVAGVSLLLLSVAVGCAIGIPIISHANDNLNYSRAEAEEIALASLESRYNRNDLEVLRVEKELEVEGRIKNARYIYVFDIYNGENEVYEIEIDGKTGKVLDIDD